jgi:3-hydroxyisobutyrate dehydrogenase-like beta-hydroxyacid dehydrogenase
MTVTGFLHPGAMGASLAAACDGERLWCSAGRSSASRERAAKAGMHEAGSLAELVAQCDVIVSVCPPGSALDVATGIKREGFEGIYADVNAIAPATAREIGAMFDHYVDGGVIGPPAYAAGTTRLYLSGADGATVASRWAGSLVETRVVDGGAGAASAVKMCFAAWTKGTSALLLNIRALAAAEGVDEAVLAEWATSLPVLAAQSETAARTAAPKAWRFGDEMREIASSFAAHGLPNGFGQGAADVYDRLAAFKDTTDGNIADVVAALLRNQPPASGEATA